MDEAKVALAVAALMNQLRVREITISYEDLQRASEARVACTQNAITQAWHIRLEPKPMTLEATPKASK